MRKRTYIFFKHSLCIRPKQELEFDASELEQIEMLETYRSNLVAASGGGGVPGGDDVDEPVGAGMEGGEDYEHVPPPNGDEDDAVV